MAWQQSSPSRPSHSVFASHHDQLPVHNQFPSVLSSSALRHTSRSSRDRPRVTDQSLLGINSINRSFLGVNSTDRSLLGVNSAAAARSALSRRGFQSSLRDRIVNRKPLHIKKPLNAFMLFMKEMRAKVVDECTLKESAAINQILGRKVWNAVIAYCGK